jgi:tetratricopeptide (TPR) repeat protein
MLSENSRVHPLIFPAFKNIEEESISLRRDTFVYAEISLKIFAELNLPDLNQAKLVCRAWKQLIQSNNLWKKCGLVGPRITALKENPLDVDRINLLDSSMGEWTPEQTAIFLWQDPTTIISDSIVAKVNAAAAYLKEEGFELKGVASDGDCFFSAFLESYTYLSRKIPLLEEQADKISYLRQVLSGIVKHTDSQRAEEIGEEGAWVSGIGEGDLLASALSIPIRLITVNEEQLICGIHDRLIFSMPGLVEGNRSQEWKAISLEERPKEYIFIVDLGGHFVYAQPLKQTHSPLSKSKVPYSFFSDEDNSFYPHKKAKITVKTSGIKRALLQITPANKSRKKRRLAPSSLTSLPLKIFKQIFLSFSTLNDNELRSILDARSCAKVFRKYMPSNSKFLTKYQPQKMPLYLDKLANWLQETISPINQGKNVLTNARLENAEEAYTQALKIAIRKKDLLQESFCIEKLGDIYLKKETPETLLQAAGLYNYALSLAPEERKEIIRDRLGQVQNLLARKCKGKSLDSAVMKKQFESNRHTLKKFREEIEKKVQALPESPSSQEVKGLYSEIAHQIKIFFEQLTTQALHQLDTAPCEYAMIGFGSLAREEMTPYSDLEFGILIQENNPINKKYFRNLTNLLHLKVINLGETILPALNIPCLKTINFFDSMTPRGFAFDGAGVEGKGCKTPLGNGKTFELIQTPEQMAQYVGKDGNGQWWHEKEPHLPMELLNHTHLLGNKELTKAYDEKIREGLDMTYQENIPLRHYLAKEHLVLADMETFNPGMGDLDKHGMLFQVKNDFYRFPHLAIDRLALLKKVTVSDTFTRIDKLSELGIMTQGATEKLKDWMSLALFMRLKTYSHYRAQKEMMNPLLKPFGFEDPNLIKQQFALDHKSLKWIKKIYRIFIPFYQAIEEFLAGNEDELKSSDLEDYSPEMRGNILQRLFQQKKAEKWYHLAIKANSQNSIALSALGNIYRQQGDLSKALDYRTKTIAIDLKLFGENHPSMAANYINLALIYKEQGNLDMAAGYADKALAINLKLYGEKHPVVSKNYSALGLIFEDKGNLGMAAEYANKALAIDLKLFGESHPTVATNYNNLGQIYDEKGNVDKAKEYINKALAINLKLFGESHPEVTICYNNLGTIYQDQGNLDKAAMYSTKSLAINLKLFGKTYPRVAIDYSNLGLIYKEQGNLNIAAEHTKKALDIDLKLYGENHSSVATDYNNLGRIYQAQGNLDIAKEYIIKALGINFKLYGDNHPIVADGYHNVGQIYQAQGNLDKAKEYINKALAIKLKLFGENHRMVAINYMSLALIYLAQRDLNQAAEYTTKALAITLKLFGENYPLVAINYNSLGQIYQEQGSLDKATEYRNKALAINLKLFGENHPTVAASYANLGAIYQEQGNLDKATEYANKALAIELKHHGENHPEVARCYTNLGTIYQEQGNLDKATEYTSKALAINLKLFGDNHPKVAIVYNNLGQIYKDQGNLDKAAEYSRKTLAINLKHFGKNHPILARNYNNLGAIYQEQCNLNKALEYSQKALTIDLKLFDENHPTVATDYNNLGRIYQEQGNLGQAEEHTSKALAINHKLFGENYPKVATSYTNLGTIYQEQGNLDKATEYTNKALAINLKLFGENHPTVARNYNNLGVIYQEQGNLGRAEEYANKALVIGLKLFGEDHPMLAIDYINVGQICKEQGRLDKALEYTQKALAINFKLFGENHSAAAICYSNLGQIYQEQGNLDKAAEYSTEALAIKFKLFGENHPTVAINYNNLGAIYQEQGNLGKAEEYASKALAIDLKFLGENHPTVATNYNHLGRIYQAQGNLDQAEEYINKALAINLKLFGENHPDVARDYNNLGQIYQAQCNLDKAVEYSNKALTINLSLFGENHPDVAICYNNLGVAYQEQGNLDKAAEYTEKALVINLKLFGVNHPSVVANYNDLGEIYQLKGNMEKTLECVNHALRIAIEIYGCNHPIVAALVNRQQTLKKETEGAKYGDNI